MIVPELNIKFKGDEQVRIFLKGWKIVFKHGAKPLYYSKLMPYLKRRQFILFNSGKLKGQKVALSVVTKQIYKEKNMIRTRPLEPKGELYESLMGRGKYKVEYIGKRKMSYGTKVPYAKTLQYGKTIEVTQRMINWFAFHGIRKSFTPIKIKPRPFLYLDNEAKRDIERLTYEYLYRTNTELLYYEPAGPFRWLAP